MRAHELTEDRVDSVADGERAPSRGRRHGLHLDEALGLGGIAVFDGVGEKVEQHEFQPRHIRGDRRGIGRDTHVDLSRLDHLAQLTHRAGERRRQVDFLGHGLSSSDRCARPARVDE